MNVENESQISQEESKPLVVEYNDGRGIALDTEESM